MDIPELQLATEMADRAEHDLFVAAYQYRLNLNDPTYRYKFLDELQDYVVVQKLLNQAHLDIISDLATPKKKFWQFWK